MCFIVLYGRVEFTLRIRGNPGSSVQSDVINSASTTLLKMAVAVTSVFAVAIGYAQCYFTVVFTGIIGLDYPRSALWRHRLWHTSSLGHIAGFPL